jgi:hypothetical protein
MRARSLVVLVAGLACARHSAGPPGPSYAQRTSDSLEAVILTACPHFKDSVAPWRQVDAKWDDDSTHPTWSKDSLRRVLLVMEDTDQAVRFASETHPNDSTLGPAMAAIDKENERRLGAILGRYGWPTRSLVGAKGESAAWLIMQHADLDSSGLQRRGLALMQAAPPGEVKQSEIAYLTDRVRVNANQPQLYGTQFGPLPDSGVVLRPIEDEAHVEERRARAGIEPLEDYICIMRATSRTRVLRHPPAGGT